MTILKALKNLVAVSAMPSIYTDDGDVITTPPVNLSYEVMPMPDGPGVEQIRSVTDRLPPLSIRNGPWIAGGAARRLLLGESLDDGDIDLFFADSKSWNLFCQALSDYEIIIKTTRATTYLVEGMKVQLIRRKFYHNLLNVFRDFDFSVCQIATDGVSIACTKQAHLDILDQVLRLAPGGSVAKHTLVQRLSKYVNHGLLPEPGLFELVVKSGLDYASAYSIFSDTDVAIYDEFVGEVEEEIIPVDELNDGVLRTIARRLGLEKTDD